VFIEGESIKIKETSACCRCATAKPKIIFARQSGNGLRKIRSRLLSIAPLFDIYIVTGRTIQSDAFKTQNLVGIASLDISCFQNRNHGMMTFSHILRFNHYLRKCSPFNVASITNLISIEVAAMSYSSQQVCFKCPAALQQVCKA